MDKNEALTKLKVLVKSGDPERAHGEADDVLCALLVSLGYNEVVTIYKLVPKWYA